MEGTYRQNREFQKISAALLYAHTTKIISLIKRLIVIALGNGESVIPEEMQSYQGTFEKIIRASNSSTTSVFIMIFPSMNTTVF
jgi:hypothetical protein